eukprot:3826497-Rhodomonas_salina.1
MRREGGRNGRKAGGRERTVMARVMLETPRVVRELRNSFARATPPASGDTTPEEPPIRHPIRYLSLSNRRALLSPCAAMMCSSCICCCSCRASAAAAAAGAECVRGAVPFHAPQSSHVG